MMDCLKRPINDEHRMQNKLNLGVILFACVAAKYNGQGADAISCPLLDPESLRLICPLPSLLQNLFD